MSIHFCSPEIDLKSSTLEKTQDSSQTLVAPLYLHPEENSGSTLVTPPLNNPNNHNEANQRSAFHHLKTNFISSMDLCSNHHPPMKTSNCGLLQQYSLSADDTHGKSLNHSKYNMLYLNFSKMLYQR